MVEQGKDRVPLVVLFFVVSSLFYLFGCYQAEILG